MITPKQLKAIDITYFTILASGSFTVTLQSRNTGHCWHILFQEYPHFKSCLIYHTHHKGSPYHRHGHSPSLPGCIRQIKRHDAYWLSRQKRNPKPIQTNSRR